MYVFGINDSEVILCFHLWLTCSVPSPLGRVPRRPGAPVTGSMGLSFTDFKQLHWAQTGLGTGVVMLCRKEGLAPLK